MNDFTFQPIFIPFSFLARRGLGPSADHVIFFCAASPGNTAWAAAVGSLRRRGVHAAPGTPSPPARPRPPGSQLMGRLPGRPPPPPPPRDHGGRDPLQAAEQPPGAAEQDRGAPGRRHGRTAHPQGGRRDHCQRGQVGPAGCARGRGASGVARTPAGDWGPVPFRAWAAAGSPPLPSVRGTPRVPAAGPPVSTAAAPLRPVTPILASRLQSATPAVPLQPWAPVHQTSPVGAPPCPCAFSQEPPS